MDSAASDPQPRIVEPDGEGEAGAAAESGGAVPAPSGDNLSPEDARPEALGAADLAAAMEEAFAAPEGEEWNRLSGTLLWYHRALLLAVSVPAALLGAAAVWAWAGWFAAACWCVLATVAGGTGWFAAAANQRSWGYAEGRTGFYLTYGLVLRQLVAVPYGRMQVVDITSNLLEQAMGIATVRIRTAATTADTRVPGLPPGEAVALRNRLAERSETFSTGL